MELRRHTITASTRSTTSTANLPGQTAAMQEGTEAQPTSNYATRRRTVAPTTRPTSQRNLSARTNTSSTALSSYGRGLERRLLHDDDDGHTAVPVSSSVAPSLLLLPQLVIADDAEVLRNGHTTVVQDWSARSRRTGGGGAPPLIKGGAEALPHVKHGTVNRMTTTPQVAVQGDSEGDAETDWGVVLAPLAVVLKMVDSSQVLRIDKALTEDLQSRDTLNLSSMQLGDAKVVAIAPALAHLARGRRPLPPPRQVGTGGGGRVVVEVDPLPKLRCLWLANNRIGDTGLAALAQCIAAQTATATIPPPTSSSSLQSLALQNNTLTYRSLSAPTAADTTAFANAVARSGMTGGQLCTTTGDGVEEEGVRAQQTAKTSAASMLIASNQQTPMEDDAGTDPEVTATPTAPTEGMGKSPFLVLLSCMPHLEMLSLHNNPVLCCPPPGARGDDARSAARPFVMQLAMGVAHAHGLRVLYLSNTWLGDAGAEALACVALPCLARLEKLVLAANRISDAGVEFLAIALEARRRRPAVEGAAAVGFVMEDLDMSKNYIGGDGVRRLRELRVHRLVL